MRKTTPSELIFIWHDGHGLLLGNRRNQRKAPVSRLGKNLGQDIDDNNKTSTIRTRMPLYWTAFLLGIAAAAPVVAEAVLQIYASYVTKGDHLFRADAQTGWSNAPRV